MPEPNRRETLFEEARAELTRQLEGDGARGLDEHERRALVERCVRSLTRRWPELDGQLCRRLMAEALTDQDTTPAGGVPHPSSGHANVTTLRRDYRESAR